MPPNLRCVVSQGWRSIGSRRNLSSSPGSNGEPQSIYKAVKSGFYPSFTTFRFTTWAIYGFTSYACFEMYQCVKLYREYDELSDFNLEDIKRG